MWVSLKGVKDVCTPTEPVVVDDAYRYLDGEDDQSTDHALGRSRSGFISTPHLTCEGRAPLSIRLTSGNINDTTPLGPTLTEIRVSCPGPTPDPTRAAAGRQGLLLGSQSPPAGIADKYPGYRTHRRPAYRSHGTVPAWLKYMKYRRSTSSRCPLIAAGDLVVPSAASATAAADFTMTRR